MAAAPILVPLALCGLGAAAFGGKKLIEVFRKLPPDSPYDLVIEIDNITELHNGWDIGVRFESIEELQPQLSPYVPKRKNAKGEVRNEPERKNLIAVTGQFNHGKTWFLSRLSSENLKKGNMVHTKGLSLKFSEVKDCKNFVLLDTEGSDSCVPENQIEEKRATESFQRELVLQLATIVVVVVNRLRRSDQVYIKSVIKNLCQQQSDPHDMKSLYIVHNFVGTAKVEDVDKLINQEVEGTFKAKRESLLVSGIGGEATFWQSKQKAPTADEHTVTLQHFVVAEEGTEAGDKWNKQSFKLIHQLIEGAYASKREIRIIPEVISFAEQRLPHYVRYQNPQLEFTDACKIQLKGDFPKEKPELTLMSFDPAGFLLSVSNSNGTIRPPVNIVETGHYYDVTLSLCGLQEPPKAKFLPGNKVQISASRPIYNDFPPHTLPSRFLHKDIGLEPIVFLETFSKRIDTKRKTLSMDKDGLYSYRIYKIDESQEFEF
mmetsp:Transcript_29668/g.40989  ORF Transcript_29668/g.40989 Transcript_29668/m.40989 type:complete len:488 (-) Transcript_29668:85-1548(-)|eukprot:CAMPEP_0201491112 /NCGR_PEP_ID=MMETSP0151_2-20130828/28602_1 /ASSEMBLY_ACC=CAM_ASM_000257 /TAXON_ID=200890 /ORGANISM="Paramoeba atlantica, Strain 621/1 / CCAP 1560/9" /LENGTH=487 /DNA_ID=CAMNT_0047877325 /DNA_START=153 /DNA_END=1616 /DNA_ORIENTATION=+